MRTALDADELNAVLSELVERSRGGQYSVFHHAFQFMFQHGFRVEELRFMHKWHVSYDGLVTCKTSKGGGDRLLNLEAFNERARLSLQDTVNYLYPASYRTIDRAFDHYLPFLRLEVGTKHIACHAFRHNRMKQLERGGFERTTIKTMFALSHLATVSNYCDSVLYKVEKF